MATTTEIRLKVLAAGNAVCILSGNDWIAIFDLLNASATTKIPLELYGRVKNYGSLAGIMTGNDVTNIIASINSYSSITYHKGITAKALRTGGSKMVFTGNNIWALSSMVL
jgi:hypothetical protein